MAQGHEDSHPALPGVTMVSVQIDLAIRCAIGFSWYSLQYKWNWASDQALSLFCQISFPNIFHPTPVNNPKRHRIGTMDQKDLVSPFMGCNHMLELQ